MQSVRVCKWPVEDDIGKLICSWGHSMATFGSSCYRYRCYYCWGSDWLLASLPNTTTTTTTHIYTGVTTTAIIIATTITATTTGSVPGLAVSLLPLLLPVAEGAEEADDEMKTLPCGSPLSVGRWKF